MNISEICSELRTGANLLAQHTSIQKNHALECVELSLEKNKDLILEANARDVESSRARGLSESLVERLALDEKKFDSILQGVKTIIQQGDPIGEETAGWSVPNGMQIRQIRVPLGVVAIIYESRPNVTVDAFALAYKSGNAILLRGSSSALESNKALVDAITQGLKDAGRDGVTEAIRLCTNGSHEEVNEILNSTGMIDVVLPRGGAKLINTVVENAHVPVIQTGAGVCHLYVDEDCDVQMASDIAANAKMQRPGACNAIETILVNKRNAGEFLPLMVQKFDGKVKMHAGEVCYPIIEQALRRNGTLEVNPEILVRATEEDFGYEFLDMEVAIKCVDSVEEAISFINTHNTKHSEAIVTNNRTNARMFQAEVDAACVYVNASTRFTDGGEFGFGAELGISTQKLHARGPMGIKALTTTKFLIDGDGQIR